jgi:2-dehydro-3-deoxyphosphogluconate aldolase/(4S)-4-hydroxy-2-oxoglutarate aldolase
MKAFLDRLETACVVAVIRSKSPADAVAAAHAVVRGGVTGVEVAFSTPQAEVAIAQLRRELPEMLIGAGTVIEPGQLDAACDAGAQFMMSPHFDPEMVARSVDRGVPFLPGAFTPSEIHAAWKAGAACVKVFPAAQLGPKYLAAVRVPLPHIPLLATGGVSANNLHEWLQAGAVALGVGGHLVRGSEAEMEAVAQQFARAIASYRGQEG